MTDEKLEYLMMPRNKLMITTKGAMEDFAL